MLNNLLDMITLKAMRERRRTALNAEEFTAELAQIDNTYHRVFTSTDGKFVLEHLAKICLTGSIAIKDDTYLDIGVKQGRADLVKEIIQRIEKAKIS